MRARLLILGILTVTTAAHADVPPSPTALRVQAAQITGGVYQGPSLEKLTELTETIGPRLSGTKAYNAAAQWALRELKAAGASNVRVEKARMSASWQRGTASARLVTPVARPLHVAAFGWTPSTKGAVRGPVIVLDRLEPAAWRPLTSRLAGAIVMLAPPPPGEDDPKELLWIKQSLPLLAKAGARALLLAMSDRRPNNVLGTGGVDAVLAPLPVGTLGYEDAMLIARKASAGTVTMELSLVNRVGGPVDVETVVGEIAGTDAAAGWLLVGAHLDSWDLGTGAQDNATGVVSVIETARMLATVGPLKRTVRFALWGGEEQGILGSRAYVTAHASELAQCVAVLNTDAGAGHVKGWNVAREEVKATLMPIARTLLASLGGSTLRTSLGGGSDQHAFVLAGVPTLDLIVDEEHYGTVHHKSADTLDKVDPHAFASGIAVVAVTAYALAMSTTPLAPRLDHAGIGKLLAREGLDEVFRLDGWWK